MNACVLMECNEWGWGTVESSNCGLITWLGINGYVSIQFISRFNIFEHCSKALENCSNISLAFYKGNKRPLHVEIGTMSAWTVMECYDWRWGTAISSNISQCNNVAELVPYLCDYFFCLITLYCVRAKW